MDNLLLYLLKVSVGTTLFYLCYLLLFSRDTFYLRNRVFLILTLLLPTILPAVRIPVMSNDIVPAVSAFIVSNNIPSEAASEITVSGPIKSFDYHKLLIWIYFIVTGLLILRIIISLLSTQLIIKKGTIKNSHFPKVVISEMQHSPFSFFPYAVIPAEDFKNGNYIDLLDHEFAHIRQGHTFDLLLSEVFIAFQWFNPFIWLIKRSIILNHEYLADHISLSNKSVKEYQYRILNFREGLKSISLAHNFNSLIKNRIIMINKKPTLKYAMLKNILILPIIVFVVYAFATPDYVYSSVNGTKGPSTINLPGADKQNVVKGIVLNEESKPIKGVMIMSTGHPGETFMATTGLDGRFIITVVQSDASLTFFCRGYIGQTQDADFSKGMVIKMVKDPDYIGPVGSDEFGDKMPFVPQRPEDFPTFRGNSFASFPNWIIKQIKYPPEAIAKKFQGRVAVSYTVELDGTVSKVSLFGNPNQILGNVVLKTVQSSPKWEPAKNPEVKEPFSSNFYIIFQLPDKIIPDDAYAVVEQMPNYPGGEAELFNFIKTNIRYPDEARSKKIEGRVILRFIVDTNGNVEEPEILKGINPLLDSEAIRVVSLLKFKPGLHRGKPVKVYYSAPISFTLN